jgi:hypothetical protein
VSPPNSKRLAFYCIQNHRSCVHRLTPNLKYISMLPSHLHLGLPNDDRHLIISNRPSACTYDAKNGNYWLLILILPQYVFASCVTNNNVFRKMYFVIPWEWDDAEFHIHSKLRVKRKRYTQLFFNPCFIYIYIYIYIHTQTHTHITIPVVRFWNLDPIKSVHIYFFNLVLNMMMAL